MPMFKIKFLLKNSEYFPKKLLDLPDCPELLFVIGNEKVLNTFSLSIVGTRNSTQSANQITFDLSQNLSSFGISRPLYAAILFIIVRSPLSLSSLRSRCTWPRTQFLC